MDLTELRVFTWMIKQLSKASQNPEVGSGQVPCIIIASTFIFSTNRQFRYQGGSSRFPPGSCQGDTHQRIFPKVPTCQQAVGSIFWLKIPILMLPGRISQLTFSSIRLSPQSESCCLGFPLTCGPFHLSSWLTVSLLTKS